MSRKGFRYEYRLSSKYPQEFEAVTFAYLQAGCSMNKTRATNTAIEIAKIALGSCDLKAVPYKDYANSIADFIETLADRLEKMGGND